MSSSDILDVLNIGRSSEPPKKKLKGDVSVQQQDQQKLTGINRELYQLLGQNTPTIPIRNQQKFKDRLNALAKPSSWTRTSFRNDSRKDGLRLKHWVKGSKEVVEKSDLPYKFEKYNTHLDIPNFTEEDYELFIAEDDKFEEDEITEDTTKQNDENGANDADDDDSNEKYDKANGIKDKIEPHDESDSFTKTDNDLSIDRNDNQTDVKKSIEEEEDQQPVVKSKPTPWDYQETRYLFDLSVAFDLKWVVIHDRYNFQSRQRSIEDLQERFYNVCQRILIRENEDEENTQNSNLISNLNYNKKKEIERKAYLNRLLERNPAEIAEEESLLIEAKKFEVSAKKTITERASLLQLLDSPQASGPISQYLSSQGLTQLYNSLMTEKRKRRIDSPAPENPLTALNEKIKQQQIQRQKQIQQEKLEQQKKKKENPIYQLLSKHLSPKEEESYGLKIHTEKLTPGVFLRSTKTPSFKPGVQAKIAGVLNELGLGKKPVLATGKVIAKQEELLKTINTMLDLKRQVDKLEAESKILS